MFTPDVAAQESTIEHYQYADVLSETDIEQQNRLAAERNALRRELISRDRRSLGRSLKRNIGRLGGPSES